MMVSANSVEWHTFLSRNCTSVRTPTRSLNSARLLPELLTCQSRWSLQMQKPQLAKSGKNGRSRTSLARCHAWRQNMVWSQRRWRFASIWRVWTLTQDWWDLLLSNRPKWSSGSLTPSAMSSQTLRSSLIPSLAMLLLSRTSTTEQYLHSKTRSNVWTPALPAKVGSLEKGAHLLTYTWPHSWLFHSL